MTQASTPALDALIAPLTAAEFLDAYWPDRPMVSHGDPARLPPWLHRQTLESVYELAATHRGSFSVQNGRRCAKQACITNGHPADFYEMGLTLYFHDLARSVPGTREYLDRLGRELGIPAKALRAAAFASPPSNGLGFHYDTYEIFSIQLQGEKRFTIAPVEEVPNPTGDSYSPDTPLSLDMYAQMTQGPPPPPSAPETIDLQPGSVLFMPRGTWHRTEARTDSLSVSIAICGQPAVDAVVGQLRLLLLQDPSWRRPLYGWTGDAAQRREVDAQLEALRQRLPDAVQRLTTRDVMSWLRGGRHASRSLSPASRFQRDPLCELAIKHGSTTAPASVELRSWERGRAQPYGSDSTFELPPALVPALEWIAQQPGPFTVGDLLEVCEGLSVDDIQPVIELLCEGEYLQHLPFEALD